VEIFLKVIDLAPVFIKHDEMVPLHINIGVKSFLATCLVGFNIFVNDFWSSFFEDPIKNKHGTIHPLVFGGQGIMSLLIKCILNLLT
jgi:hypothetical protein